MFYWHIFQLETDQPSPLDGRWEEELRDQGPLTTDVTQLM